MVFIVDDDAAVRESLAAWVQLAGYGVATCGTASEFLQYTRPDAPSCLLLDVQLPDMSGLALQRLLTLEHWLPIVFITGHGDVATAVQAMKAGASDFLTKPLDPDRLLNVIGDALARSELSRRERGDEQQLRDRYASLTPR